MRAVDTNDLCVAGSNPVWATLGLVAQWFIPLSGIYVVGCLKARWTHLKSLERAVKDKSGGWDALIG